MAINIATKAILKILSFGGIDVEVSRQLADLKRLDPMKFFYKKMDLQVYNGDYEVPIRVFFPDEASCLEKDQIKGRKIMLFLHGGGWATEHVENYERVCSRMAQATGQTVAAVEYRLAPEHKFPTGLMDCYAVARALYTHPDTKPEDITLIGDSAGGNLAAALSIMARDRGEFMPKRQILIYPAVNNDYSEKSLFSSVRENGQDYLLTAGKLKDYINLYAGSEEDKLNPYFAPILEKDLSGQPDTLILTSEFDPLRDEGEAYGRTPHTFEKVEETPAVAVANATVVIDSNEGSFEGYEGTTELHNENLQEAEYNLGFLPTVVAKDGYTFKGWKVTNKAGEEIYNLDANATSISFPYGVADDYTVTAVLEKNEEEVAVANATVVIDSNEGSFEGYEGTTELHNENLQEAEYNLGFLPTVVAKDGYTFKGWKVTNKAGEEIYNLDANATSISFPYGVADDYTVTAVLEKNEEEVAVANATVVIDSNEGSFEGYEGTTELHNENLQEAEYNLGFLPTVVAKDGYTFKGWKVTNKAGEEIYNLDANATSISFPYGVADDYTVTAVLEKNETPVDPDQPSVDPSKPSTPEEKPGTSIEENKKDDKTSTTVAKDDKKTNKKESAKKANEQKSDTVQTGDHSNVFVYVATLLIAGAAAVVAFFRRRNA